MELELKEMLKVTKLRMHDIHDSALIDDTYNDEYNELEKMCIILLNLIKIEKFKDDGVPYTLTRLKKNMSPESIISKHLRQMRQKRQAEKNQMKGSNETNEVFITDAMDIIGDNYGTGDITIIY